MAVSGGAVYADNEAQVVSKFEKYERNTAIANGGAMYFISRTIFNISNSKFYKNYG